MTLRKSLLVACSVAMQMDIGLCEIFIDWNNLKVLKMRELCIPLRTLLDVDTEGYEAMLFSRW